MPRAQPFPRPTTHIGSHPSGYPNVVVLLFDPRHNPAAKLSSQPFPTRHDANYVASVTKDGLNREHDAGRHVESDTVEQIFDEAYRAWVRHI